MQATAAWQAAWGVTEFTLYYARATGPADQYRAYCDYVGRLNAILKPAQLDPRGAPLLPDLRSLGRVRAGGRAAPARFAVAPGEADCRRSWGWGNRCKKPRFRSPDRPRAARLGPESRKTGASRSMGTAFSSLLLPADVELPPPAARVVDELRKKGGRVLTDRAAAQLLGPTIVKTVEPPYRISPRSPYIAAGHFLRDGWCSVFLLANVGPRGISGASGGRCGGGLADPRPLDGHGHADESVIRSDPRVAGIPARDRVGPERPPGTRAVKSADCGLGRRSKWLPLQDTGGRHHVFLLPTTPRPTCGWFPEAHVVNRDGSDALTDHPADAFRLQLQGGARD